MHASASASRKSDATNEAERSPLPPSTQSARLYSVARGAVSARAGPEHGHDLKSPSPSNPEPPLTITAPPLPPGGKTGTAIALAGANPTPPVRSPPLSPMCKNWASVRLLFRSRGHTSLVFRPRLGGLPSITQTPSQLLVALRPPPCPRSTERTTVGRSVCRSVGNREGATTGPKLKSIPREGGNTQNKKKTGNEKNNY